jgi:nicotinamide-nucleotide amidase
MKAEIIAVGTELVSGQSLDTNSQWLSRALGGVGIEVRFHSAVGDDLAENIEVFRAATERADLILVSGGLGPTQDDLTREALAAVAGVPLVEDAGSLETIRAMFARRNREMSERNRVQALFPEGAEPLPNAIGTAPGIGLQVGRAWVACLPGVPNEMKRMYEDQVLPRLISRKLATRKIVHRKINLFGKGESDIEAMALDLTARGRKPEVGITASDGTISFRISSEAPTEDEARLLIEPTAAIIHERFGDLIVGEGTEDVVDAVVRELARTGRTIATAESCTGGLVARMLTSIPGVSAFYPGGVVTYSNQAKTEILGVPAALIEEHGAVSHEVAEAMARLVRVKFGTDLGIAVTGVAGPTSDSPDHPVGLVYLGLALPHKNQTRKLELGPEQPRDVIQSRAAKQALNWARISLRSLKPS